jgi:hypothetical protein
MAVRGRAQAQGFEHQQLARRVGQVIFTAQHVRDAHLGIVDGIAEEERRAAIRAPQDEVADVVGGETLRAVDHVVEFHEPARGHAKPRGRRYALGALADARLGRQIATGSGISGRPAGRQLRLARQIQLERRAIAGISEPIRIQAGRMPRVYGPAT